MRRPHAKPSGWIVGAKAPRTICAGLIVAVVLSWGPPSSSAHEQADAQSHATPQGAEPVKALEFDEAETALLEGVRDRDSRLGGDACGMLLDKAARLAALNIARAPLDRPAVASLTRYPHRWRGWPIRLRLRIYTAERVRLEGETSPSPADLDAWQLNGVAADANEAGQPVIVLSPARPTGLPAPERSADGQREIYPAGPVLETEGFFYKLWRHRDADGDIAYYPVVVVWRTAEAPPADARSPLGESRMMPLLLLGGLLCLYLIVRRNARRRGGAQDDYDARPFRSGWGRQASDKDRAASDAPVDPRLAEAAEQYRKERKAADASDDSH